MRLFLILALLPLPVLAEDYERTGIFCDQYARASAGQAGTVRGGRSGKWAGAAAGATQGGSTAVNRGALAGGALGAARGGQWDKQVYDYYLQECLSGGRLTAPWPPK